MERNKKRFVGGNSSLLQSKIVEFFRLVDFETSIKTPVVVGRTYEFKTSPQTSVLRLSSSSSAIANTKDDDAADKLDIAQLERFNLIRYDASSKQEIMRHTLRLDVNTSLDNDYDFCLSSKAQARVVLESSQKTVVVQNGANLKLELTGDLILLEIGVMQAVNDILFHSTILQ